jgi:methyl-accepting chemotaxis protein
MKNIPIIGKFLSILAIFGLFVVAVTFYATDGMRTIERNYSQLIENQTQAALHISKANRDLTSIRAKMAELMIVTSMASKQKEKADVSNREASFKSDMDEAAILDSADAADVQALKSRALQAIDTDCANSIKLSLAASTPADLLSSQAVFFTDCAPNFSSLATDVETEVDHLTAAVNKDNASLTATTGSTIITTFTAVFAGLVLVMLGGFFAIRNWITSPVKGLEGVMGRLSSGDLKTKITGIERKDEIGGMARAVQVFKEAGIEKVRLEAETEEQRARAEKARQRNESEREAAAKQLAFVVDSVATGLEKLSGGDLLFRLTNVFDNQYEKLRGDFNEAMNKLLETMKAIAINTQGVKSGAEEITQASDDLSRRTEQQAASLEETAAALDQITATVRKTAENSNEARNTASAAKADTETSGAVVRETVTAMSGIEASSKQIGNIIGVIDEIAFQTNLLALNAGVEAARAGDAGRGFAVVATEVRALAQRSADAAKEIKALISASSQQVDTGVKLVGETGKALARIAEQVARLNGLVGDISSSAQEQATGLNEVNTAVNQMDQVTQQNAAMVEQATAASHGLAGEASELAHLVSQFQIGQIAETRAAKPPARKELPKSPSPQRAAGGKVALPARQDGGPRLAMAGTQENWDEF